MSTFITAATTVTLYIRGLDADGLLRLILRTAIQQRLLQLQHAPGCRTGGGLALFFSGELRHLRPCFRELKAIR